ncbi:MAG TPA: GNAT family N-acetyltransferase [Chitinophagaceae bacterium]|nr:GNAT family N-acetyltransferase [Chitinophagaceae bacterium]
MITIKPVTELTELEGIRKLQEENLKKNLTGEEAASQGFVTAEYSIDFLKTLHEACPSIIAKEDDRVVGYALAALKSTRHHHDLLGDLFNVIDQLVYHDLSFKDTRYVVVGQLCVAKGYRGLGLVQQMYQHFKTHLSGRFDYCITDVAQDNPRSLKAHLKTGFRVIDTLTYGGFGWDIVLWDWTSYT